jgi:Na+/H+ antiporter NhaD/arsenite permease-like protein
MAIDQSGTDIATKRLDPASWIALLCGAGIVAWLIVRSLVHEKIVHEPHLPPHWGVGILPFVGILGAIAILPLIGAAHHWWEQNRNRLIVSMVFSAATILYFIVAEGWASVPDVLQHSIVDEYIPFMLFLFSLYVISGGISLRGDLPAHPITNTCFLAFGALIASFVGTTGASMLLIRPLLQTNSERRHVTHTVVFFIFLVSNIGGCLLPIGDPPLFLGYLRGVPFTWTLVLWKEWAVCCAILLVVYFIWDTIAYRRETKRDIMRDERIRKPLRISGTINFVWLFGVVLAVAQLVKGKTIPGTNFVVFPFLRELVLLGFVTLSLLTTPRGLREQAKFNYSAIIEVAALFIGIFITMQVPLMVLNVKGPELGLDTPWEFFWATGVLSSFLDNAPTYLVFFETANTLTHEAGPGIIQLESTHFMRQDLLVAISLGAVFMGANTYIGNGPNFMVKSIAEQSGIRMPSFFGFLFKFTVPVLVPLFILITVLFLL